MLSSTFHFFLAVVFEELSVAVQEKDSLASQLHVRHIAIEQLFKNCAKLPWLQIGRAGVKASNPSVEWRVSFPQWIKERPPVWEDINKGCTRVKCFSVLSRWGWCVCSWTGDVLKLTNTGSFGACALVLLCRQRSDWPWPHQRSLEYCFYYFYVKSLKIIFIAFSLYYNFLLLVTSFFFWIRIVDSRISVCERPESGLWCYCGNSYLVKKGVIFHWSL